MNIYKTIKCVCIIKLILVNYNNNANDSPYPGHAKYIVMEHNFLNLEKNIFNDSKKVLYYFVKHCTLIYVSTLYVVDLTL